MVTAHPSDRDLHPRVDAQSDMHRHARRVAAAAMADAALSRQLLRWKLQAGKPFGTFGTFG